MGENLTIRICAAEDFWAKYALDLLHGTENLGVCLVDTPIEKNHCLGDDCGVLLLDSILYQRDVCVWNFKISEESPSVVYFMQIMIILTLKYKKLRKKPDRAGSYDDQMQNCWVLFFGWWKT